MLRNTRDDYANAQMRVGFSVSLLFQLIKLVDVCWSHWGLATTAIYSGDYRGRVIPENTTVVYYVHKLMLKQIKMRQFLIQISRILLLNLLFFFPPISHIIKEAT